MGNSSSFERFCESIENNLADTYQTNIYQKSCHKKDILYVLKSSNDKYYVGVTDNLEARLDQHKTGQGSEWTKKHNKFELLYTKSVESPLDEDHEVKKLMIQYGIDNVRGGSYSNINLTSEQINTLNRELTHANNGCFHCGSTDHYAKNCKNKQNCDRCGRKSHIKSSCYAKTLKLCDIPIYELRYCSHCGRKDHSNESYSNFLCTYKTDRYGTVLTKTGAFFCERCGRSGHLIVDCFAKSTYNNIKI